jgi:hypothetical protein
MMQKTKPHLQKITAFLTVILLLTSLLPSIAASFPWKTFIQGTARVADDVPVNKADDIAQSLARSKSVMRKLDADLLKAGQLTDKMDDAARAIARSTAMLKALEKAIPDNPALLREIKALDNASQEAAVVLAKGGQSMTRVMPDITGRGQLLKRGGADVVAAVGLHGDDAARAAMRLDTAIQGGSLIIPAGKQMVTLEDFGRVMTKTGESGWQFWQKYVQPHWKLWLGSGALAVYLNDPEQFQDAAGNLSEAGFRHLGLLMGEVSAGAIRGISQGTTEVVEKVVVETTAGFLQSWQEFFSGLLILFGISLLFRRVRYYVLWPFRWLNNKPAE